MSFDKYSDLATVKFVDYGGYQAVPASDLRQIRSDFTTMPFLAVDVYLSGIVSAQDGLDWPVEALQALSNLVTNKVSEKKIRTK